jgi:hypothetical protein
MRNKNNQPQGHPELTSQVQVLAAEDLQLISGGDSGPDQRSHCCN